MENVLCVVAHPDDLEFMAGGSVARWIREGKKVHALVLTHGGWTGADGKSHRGPQVGKDEAKEAAAVLGYTVDVLANETMHLKFEDDLVVQTLERIEKMGADTLICPWDRDLHHDHEVTSRIAISASKRIPRVLMGQINNLLREVFTPNIFVDITETWDLKLRAMRCYHSEWERKGGEWEVFQDALTRYYGGMVGVERAEGFLSRKLLFE